jgi:hypothetical protein
VTIGAFWDTAPYSLLGVDRRFRVIISVMMKAVRTSETSIDSNETTRRYIIFIFAAIRTSNLIGTSYIYRTCTPCQTTKQFSKWSREGKSEQEILAFVNTLINAVTVKRVMDILVFSCVSCT